MSALGRLKDVLFPQPRLDFYALVQARKRKDSPHGQWEGGLEGRPKPEPAAVEGLRWSPKPIEDRTGEGDRLGPFY